MADSPTRITAPFLDVLEVFLDANGGELHGWAIIKASQRGGPTVYKILERMSEMGWVTARWDDSVLEPNKPRRRYYKLTGEGAVRAAAVLSDRRSQRWAATARPALGGAM